MANVHIYELMPFIQGHRAFLKSAREFYNGLIVFSHHIINNNEIKTQLFKFEMVYQYIV